MRTTEDVLRFLAKHAPDMNLGSAMELAEAFGCVVVDGMLDAEALAVLTEAELGFNANGEFPKKDRPDGVAWAMQRAQYRHAWVVCSPVSGAMAKLVEETGRRLKR
jgi:hypothetical protein